VDDFYRVRSQFVHHGQQVRTDDIQVVDTFFFNVWFIFSRLLAEADAYETKEQLLRALEDQKLS
jgi:hypothetical protein